MSQISKFVQTLDKRNKANNPSPVQIGTIITKAPLKIYFNGLEIGAEFGDNIYINNLLLDDNIELDLASMDNAQNLNNTTAYQSPSFTAEILGTQKQFLTDFYNYFKQWHKRYIIEIGDLVAVQKLGQNTYIILQKVQKNDSI